MVVKKCPCPVCDGDGYTVICPQNGEEHLVQKCTACNGKGYVPFEEKPPSALLQRLT